MFTIPKSTGTGQNVTVGMYVYNRGNSTVFEISPVSSITDMTNPSTALALEGGPVPTSINSLEPQEGVVFLYELQLIGGTGTNVSFTQTASGTDGASGDTITSSTNVATLRFVGQADSG